MEAYESWMALSRESMAAAEQAEAAGYYRSAASRYYYTAYQAATALLLYQGLATPQGRGAWNHLDTPFLIVDQTGPLLPRRDRRRNLMARLQSLYSLRVAADYGAGMAVSAEQVKAAGRDARHWRNTVNTILPRE